jgi:hypothetical protein
MKEKTRERKGRTGKERKARETERLGAGRLVQGEQGRRES